MYQIVYENGRLLEYVYKNFVDLYSQSEQSLSDVDQDFVLASTGYKNPIWR